MTLRGPIGPRPCLTRCGAVWRFRRTRWRSTRAASSTPVRQRALSRYYIDAGAGGLAVGVHSTQFAIRDVGLYEPVLRLAAETASRLDGTAARPDCRSRRPDGTGPARRRRLRCGLGYHAGLLTPRRHEGCERGRAHRPLPRRRPDIPLIGFYLQPAVGGIPLSAEFWRRFAAIEEVVAIKIAPFNRYRTLDVVRGVAAAGAEQRVALYTGNDDNIVLDLITPFR